MAFSAVHFLVCFAGGTVKRGSVEMDDGQKVEEVFLKGIGLSVYQNSGDTASNWTKFIKESGRVRDAEKITNASDFWNRYGDGLWLWTFLSVGWGSSWLWDVDCIAGCTLL